MTACSRRITDEKTFRKIIFPTDVLSLAFYAKSQGIDKVNPTAIPILSGLRQHFK